MLDQLLGTTQPVLSISLEPGETIVAGTGEFSWMTDSILMSSGRDAGPGDNVRTGTALRRTLTASSLPLSAYTARQSAGTIAFATRLPGHIVSIELAPGRDYLVHRRGFLAGTPGIEISTVLQQPYGQPGEEFVLRRIAGHGRAWIELSGDVIRRELPAGGSLRTHPWHIGMFDASVAVQMADIQEIQSDDLWSGSSPFAVLSGPGAVWLQSMSLLAAIRPRLGPPPLASALGPAFEGGAGPPPPLQTRS
jgi:uncharacterized protein (AIM24 family)